MSDEKILEPVVSIEHRMITIPEPNQKFIIAVIVMMIYLIVICVTLLFKDLQTFKDAIAVLTGPVGTVIGYYFGSEQDSS